MSRLQVRAATPGDAPVLASIYADAVLHGLGTFEETPPDAREMEARRAAIVRLGLPFLVAQRADDSVAIGFAYAAPFRSRAAYRFTVEDSVYVSPAARGEGCGHALLADVIAACEAMGLRQMVAVIGDSANHASRALHRAHGFTDAGLFPSVGFKHGRWVDVVWMRRTLGEGDTTPPTAVGLDLGG